MLISIEVLLAENSFYREQADNLQLSEMKQKEENTCTKPKNKRPSRNTLFDEIEEQKQNEENYSQHDRTSPDFIQELYKKLFHDLKEHLPAQFFNKKETPKKLSTEKIDQIESRKQELNAPKTYA
ncbi:hypothetical protein HHI36_012529 [Cryptolaemus montrouzieri]|uniref:Uncharacterized protein n=1 Tax=Cryptolaemus montrouzieri TaxID=559131 RepID=A0ABD2NEV6_9CUCU